ncbi:MAG: alpha-hydroxy-acid oxidizing protein [Reyranella sp.]|nr:MAG: alpha-hydroxy-acid oxidizing protein [Reyranella sp.]
MSNQAITIDDLRQSALRRLPRFLGEYVERGAGNGGGVRRNIEAFDKYVFLPRGLMPVASVDTSRSLFGRTYALGFGISAVGGVGIFRRNGVEMLAEAAREANIPFMLSGLSTASIEKVARLAPDHIWSQLYAAKDTAITARMVRRAHDAGVKVLVVTVDFPVPNRSEVTARSGVTLTSGPGWRTAPSVLWDVFRHPAWAWEYARGGGSPTFESWQPYAGASSNAADVAAFVAGMWPATLAWSDLEEIRRLWPGRLIVKGLVHIADILHAANLGIDGVIVSSHGGNKLDCMAASIDLLAQAAPFVSDRISLLFDGGIRRGSDMLKAIALGAEFCFVGRATLYGVVAGSKTGAERAIDIIRDEAAYVQAMIGCPKLDDVSRAMLYAS